MVAKSCGGDGEQDDDYEKKEKEDRAGRTCGPCKIDQRAFFVSSLRSTEMMMMMMTRRFPSSSCILHIQFLVELVPLISVMSI